MADATETMLNEYDEATQAMDETEGGLLTEDCRSQYDQASEPTMAFVVVGSKSNVYENDKGIN